MKKSSKAYKTIGEVAEILELDSIGKKKNTHTIRFWEKADKSDSQAVFSLRSSSRSACRGSTRPPA